MILYFIASIRMVFIIIWRSLKKLKIELPCDPAIPHSLGIYLEKTLI